MGFYRDQCHYPEIREKKTNCCTKTIKKKPFLIQEKSLRFGVYVTIRIQFVSSLADFFVWHLFVRNNVQKWLDNIDISDVCVLCPLKKKIDSTIS